MVAGPSPGVPRPAPQGERLVKILADMLRSALAWEREHGQPENCAQTEAPNALTGIPRRIHCGRRSARRRLQVIKGGKSDGDDPEGGDQASPDLRGPEGPAG
ncbi:MAG: hypothetical protein HY681_08030 [Chloroflexi bacterium]|nr:hypothetical protein [Chloroflexota bacterium]